MLFLHQPHYLLRSQHFSLKLMLNHQLEFRLLLVLVLFSMYKFVNQVQMYRCCLVVILM